MVFRFTAPEIILCIKTWICTFWPESFSNYSGVLGTDTDPSHTGGNKLQSNDYSHKHPSTSLPPSLPTSIPPSPHLPSPLLCFPLLSPLYSHPPPPNLFSKRVCPLLNCFLFHIISCHGDLISRIIWISLYLLIWEHFIFFIVFLSIFETNNHLICVSADYVRPSIEVGSCAGETNQWKNIIKLESTINQDMGDIPWLLKRSHQKIYTFFPAPLRVWGSSEEDTCVWADILLYFSR